MKTYMIYWTTVFDEEYDTCGNFTIKAINEHEALIMANKQIPYHAIVEQVTEIN